MGGEGTSSVYSGRLEDLLRSFACVLSSGIPILGSTSLYVCGDSDGTPLGSGLCTADLTLETVGRSLEGVEDNARLYSGRVVVGVDGLAGIESGTELLNPNALFGMTTIGWS